MTITLLKFHTKSKGGASNSDSVERAGSFTRVYFRYGYPKKVQGLHLTHGSCMGGQHRKGCPPSQGKVYQPEVSKQGGSWRVPSPV